MSAARGRILLHVCCAGCAEACIETLHAAGWSVALFFSNSNIDPPEEYQRRLKDFRRLCSTHGLQGIEDTYDHERWRAAIAGLEQEPERGQRCSSCFSYNLERTAQAMRDHGFDAFTTTLTVSPHKVSAQVFAAARAWPEFLAADFKKQDGFRRSVAASRRQGYYRQHYCGCEFSLRPRNHTV